LKFRVLKMSFKNKYRQDNTVAYHFPRELQEKEEVVMRPPLANAVFQRPTSPEANSKEQPARTENSLRPLRPASAQLPPKELPQAELNRAFTDELLKAKNRLRSSGGVSGGGSKSQDEEEDGGVPPPPPPPVLPPPSRGANQPMGGQRSQLPPPALNPREELLLAIRNVGGARGLRKTRE
jgi:hypothetical protein